MSWIRKWVRKKLGGEGGNPGTSIWIHTAILWLESRYKQCCCCCKVKVWITVLHSVWQNKRGEYQRGDHCTICYLKGPLHLFYTWTYHSLCLWGNLTCINYICKKKKKGYPVIVLVNKQISAVTVENMQYNKITVLFLFFSFCIYFPKSHCISFTSAYICMIGCLSSCSSPKLLWNPAIEISKT